MRGTVNGVFKDCTFTGQRGLRWCDAGDTVVFENCVFSGSVYGAHFDGGANDVYFKGCTFSGFNAFGGEITKLTLEDCTFKSNSLSSDNGVNLWGSTTMIRCEFIFDGTAATEWVDCIGTDKTYVFEDCTVNGLKYTPENYLDFKDLIWSRNTGGVPATINGVSCTIPY